MDEDAILLAQHPLYREFCREPEYDPDSGYYDDNGDWVAYDDMEVVDE